MDERETIPRREAMAGLGVLALLSAGLVGTIVFRIVSAAPQRAGSEPVAIASTDGAAAVANAAEPTASADVGSLPMAAAGEEREDNGGISSLPQVTPATSDGPVSVPAAPIEEAPRWNPAATSPPPAERPRFVAPATR
jgi:hypothetical protein